MKPKITDQIRSTLQRIINALGFDIYRLRRVELGGLIYEAIKPKATFAPWCMDTAFQEIFKAIQNHTHVDKYRCYELWSLVEQSQKANVGALIEVGVWRGGSGAVIAQQAKNAGISEPVYLCDTFSGVVKASEKDVLVTPV